MAKHFDSESPDVPDVTPTYSCRQIEHAQTRPVATSDDARRAEGLSLRYQMAGMELSHSELQSTLALAITFVKCI